MKLSTWARPCGMSARNLEAFGTVRHRQFGGESLSDAGGHRYASTSACR
ncbi:MAG: hypothetical protein JRN51_09545 [Nitrososphaerota archaeon]|nr:hypothetical protein [Nitrososphaerota archaeon]MDG6981336.1 hypothetical protein [Nitrososphaerota archaeon]